MAGAKQQPPAVSSWWLVPRVCTTVFILGCCSLFLAWIADWLTDSHPTRFAAVQAESYDLRSPDAHAAPLLSGYDFEKFYFTWLPILAAALASIGLYHIPQPSCPPGWWHLSMRKLRGFATLQLWPSRFWMWFTGGMNLAEAFFLLCILFLNAFYFQQYYRYYEKEVTAAFASGMTMPGSYSLVMFERMSLTFGIMCWPNFWLLFFPLPHCGFLTTLLGLPYKRIIKYHRWLGHITMVIVTVHSVGYYIYWAAVDVPFWKQFADWSTRSFVNNLGGSLAFFAVLVLWITSANWCRRHFFEVFYRCHILMFVLFVLFYQIHYYYAWTMLLPGLILYFADVALRAGQLQNLTPLHVSTLCKEGAVMTVQMTTDKGFIVTPKQDIFMQIPQIDRFAWHPFTIASHHTSGKDGTGIATLHIKRYSDWTKELFVRSQVKGQQLRAKVVGPFDNPITYRKWEAYSTAVLIGGGIGAVPLLAMLDDLVERVPAGQAGALRKVVFVWLSHTGDEFSILNPAVLELARQVEWLEISLHVTRKPVMALMLPSSGESSPGSTPHKHSGPPAASPLPKQPSPSGSTTGPEDSLSDQKMAAALPLAANVDRAAEEIGPTDPRALAESAWGWQPRPAQPGFQQHGLVEALVLILSFAGALFGTVLTAAYYAEHTVSSPSGEAPEEAAWIYGILLICGQAIGALGLPYALIIWPLHTWRHFTNQAPARFSFTHGLVPSLNLDPMLPQLHMSRPDLWALLRDVVTRSDCPEQHGYGVFVAGPPPMWESCQRMTQAIRTGGVAITVFQEASQL